MAGRTRSGTWKNFENLCSEDLRAALSPEACSMSFQVGADIFSLVPFRVTANMGDDTPTFYQAIVNHLEHIHSTWGIKGIHQSGACESTKSSPMRFAMMIYVNETDKANVQAFIDGI